MPSKDARASMLSTPGVVDEALMREIRSYADKPTENDLGVVTASTISRYARAVGLTDPIHYDSEAARAHGFRDVVAPLNLLPSIVDWTAGAPVEELRPDGTSVDESTVGVPTSGYRIMGGGERMEFHEPLVAGDRVIVTARLVDVDLRQTRSGPMLVVRYHNGYRTDAGVLLMSCERSVLVRNGEDA
ncbi:FAS1-like dehydratase domain-containing protein [Nocardia cyriacigeorgica]|uniref:FAS1-like dehydratase domain-containing protein n=1 Tax=Nocardia cyriacigeorgica TaxID=135487 RepID=UPI0013D5100D|nr:MaoC family dehydratase N-terminal domain-containing protein [Nocardia cyriacigeorgica]NEW27109.1 MaoC family dehydratase [Nocardia cyriacigeorgica]